MLAAAEQQQLQNNVTSLSEELEGNPGRGGVLARLGAGIATKQIAALAGCSVRTMQRAKKDQRENPARDKRFKETLPLHRIRVPINEKQATIRWLHEICPTRSGTKYFMQYCLSKRLYEEYKEAVTEKRITWPRKRRGCKAETGEVVACGEEGGEGAHVEAVLWPIPLC